MNASNQPLITLRLDCNSAVQQLMPALRSAGLVVLKSFDLYSTIPARSDCSCGSDSCACQMVVLLVYAQGGPPISLVCESDGCQTVLYLVNNPQQSIPLDWMNKLALLIPASFSSTNPATPQGK